MMRHRFLPVELLTTLLAATYAIPSLYFALPATYYDSLEQRLSSASYRQQSAAAALLPNVKSQFHAQDELGQYTYGYNDGLSSKIESKSADGVTKGSYAYIDSNGIVQNVNYMADEDGFRVSATNLPAAAATVGTSAEQEPSSALLISQPAPNRSPPSSSEPETIVVPESANRLDETTVTPNGTESADGDSSDRTRSTGSPATAESNVTDSAVVTAENPTAEPVLAVVPVVASQPVDHDDGDGLSSAYDGVPFARPNDPYRFYETGGLLSLQDAFPSAFRDVAPPPIGPIYSQYHSQDELGQYSYGYSGGPSSKAETKTFDGITRGGYSYVDPNGIIQKVSYVSDPINGFRVSGTNLPFPSFPAYIASPYYSPIPEFHFNRIYEGDGKSKRDTDPDSE